MNPEPRFVGRVGYIVAYSGTLAGMAYYTVDFDGQHDVIDECNLEVA